jgi:hypothetical protein
LKRGLAVLAALLISISALAQQGQSLITTKLDAWEIIGDGKWVVTEDGTLVAYRSPETAKLFPTPDATLTRQQLDGWRNQQSWLYTKRDYAEYDLHVEYWITAPGNSGISLRDPSRGKYGVTIPPDFKQTPSKLGYEIQIASQYKDPNPSGSIYTLAPAKVGAQKDLQWNAMDIESRTNLIRVRLNGQVVAEHPGDPQRPKTGPIGLQLHDQFSTVMFRNIRIRELSGSAEKPR